MRNASSAYAVISTPTVMSAKSRRRRLLRMRRTTTSGPPLLRQRHRRSVGAAPCGGRRPLPHATDVEARPLPLREQVREHRLGVAVHDAVLGQPDLLGDCHGGLEATDVEGVVRVRADRERGACGERRLGELALAHARARARAGGVEAVIVEFEDDVVAHRRLDDCVEVERELLLVARMRDLVDERVRHHAQERLGVADAVGLVPAGVRVEAHRDEVEPAEDEVGQVEAVLRVGREVGLAALQQTDAVEHARDDLEVPEVPLVRALRDARCVVGDGDELEAARARDVRVLGQRRERVP